MTPSDLLDTLLSDSDLAEPNDAEGRISYVSPEEYAETARLANLPPTVQDATGRVRVAAAALRAATDAYEKAQAKTDKALSVDALIAERDAAWKQARAASALADAKIALARFDAQSKRSAAQAHAGRYGTRGGQKGR